LGWFFPVSGGSDIILPETDRELLEVKIEIDDLRELAFDSDRPKQNRRRFSSLTAGR
jgi:hypothetical protein